MTSGSKRTKHEQTSAIHASGSKADADAEHKKEIFDFGGSKAGPAAVSKIMVGRVIECFDDDDSNRNDGNGDFSDNDDVVFEEEAAEAKEYKPRLAKIQFLNDKLPVSGVGRVVVITTGFQCLSTEVRSKAIWILRTKQTFDTDNDPWQEHDFGMFCVGGPVLLWAIGYYDIDLSGLSSDPSNPAVTRQVLVLVLAVEHRRPDLFARYG